MGGVLFDTNESVLFLILIHLVALLVGSFNAIFR